MVAGGVVTGELVLNTSKFIANFDKAMQRVQNSAGKMGNIANPIEKSFNSVRNSISRLSNEIVDSLTQTGAIFKNNGALLDSWTQRFNKSAISVGQFERILADAQGSFAATGRTFTANNSLMAEASRQLGKSFIDTLGTANKAEAAIANMLQTPAKYVPKAAAAMNNFSNQAQAGFRNLVDTIDSYGTGMVRSTEATGSRMVNAWNGVMSRMSNSSNAGVRSIGNNLTVINNSRFDKLATNFESVIKRMGNIASSGAQSIMNKLQSGLSASDYMATIFGGMLSGQIWDNAMGKATTQAMLGLSKSKEEAAKIMAGYQQYTIASSTSDQQISNLLKYVTQSGIQANETYRALSAMDAAAYSSDPVQRQERLRNYGNYLTNGYSEAQFRGDVTSQQASILQSAQTPEQRIAAMETVAKMQGSMDQFGNNLSTMTTGPLANYNKVLIITDTLMRAAVQGFNDLLNAASPLLDWFIALNPETQSMIGKFAFFTGGALVLASTLGILISVLSPVFGMFGFLAAAAVSLATGTSMATLSTMGFAGTLDYAAISFVAYITGTEAATVANAGLASSLYAAAAGFLTMEIAGAPIWAIIIAVVALGAAIYGVGAYLGWWNDLAGMGAAIMAQLQYVWMLMSEAIDQVTWSLAPLAQIWTIITSAFYDSEGNWLGLFQGLMNIDWGGIFSSIQTVMTNLGTMVYHWIRAGITGVGGVFGIQELLFGWTYADGSQTQGIVTRIYNAITSIDWVGIITSALTTVAQLIASYNPMTLLITAIFGSEAGNAYSTQIMQGFYSIINALTWIAGAIGNTITFFSPAFNTLYNIFAGFYNGATIIWNALLIILTGVWNAIVAAGTSLWNSLQGIINPLINIFQVLWDAVNVIWTNIVNAWNLFTGAFFDSEGKWIGIIPGIANVLGLLWDWLANMDWAGLGSAILSGLMTIAIDLGSAFLSMILAIPNALGSAAMSLGTSIYNWFVSTDWLGLFIQLGQFLVSLNPIVLIWNAIFGTGDSGKGQGEGGGQGGSGGNSVASNIQNSFLGVDWIGLFTQIGQFIASYNPITLIVTVLFGEDAGKQFSDAIMNAFSTVGNIFSLIGQYLFGGGVQQTGADISTWINNLTTTVVTTVQDWITSLPTVLSDAATGAATWIAAAVPEFLSTLFTLIGHYNPITLITVLIFGPEEGQKVQNQTIQFLWGIVDTFTRGLTTLYNTAVWIGTTIYNFFTWLWTTIYDTASYVWNTIYFYLILIWNTIYTNAMIIWNGLIDTLTFIWNTLYDTVMFVWNTIYFYLMLIWNTIYMNAMLIWTSIWNTLTWVSTSIWNTIMWIWTSIWNTLNWVWTSIWSTATWIWNSIFNAVYGPLARIWSIAVGLGNAIWSTLSSVFHRIYDTVKPIFDKISSAFGSMRDGLINAATRIRDAVWGPIQTLYNHLKGFWDWITHPFSGGNSGGNAGGNNAGPRPAGYSGGSTSTRYSGGFFAGIRDAAFNRTAALTGHMPKYAGPRSFGNDQDEERMNYRCGEDSCYAGNYDFSQTWIDEALKIIHGWSMNINGESFKLQTLAQSGNLGVFNAIASKLIGGTHYEYYYNHKYTPAEIISQTHACNCWDGAMLLLTLASKMGLPARLGRGKWGSDDHVWAVIAGQVFDTTAYQQGYGWRAPQVKYSGPSYGRTSSGGYYAGSNDSITNIYLTFEKEVYNPKEVAEIVDTGIRQKFAERDEKNNNTIKSNIRF